MGNLIDQRTTKQVRIDAGLHKLLKIEAAKQSRTIRELLEESLTEYLAVDRPLKKRYEKK